MPRNRRVTLAARPVGEPKPSDFALDEADIGSAGPGEALVRILYASVDPYQRGRMSEARSYAAPLQIGDVVTSQSLAEVVESGDPRFEPGTLVVGQLGWQEYAVTRAGALRRIPAAVFCEAIYGRFVRGELTEDDARARRFEQGVPLLAETAAAIVGAA